MIDLRGWGQSSILPEFADWGAPGFAVWRSAPDRHQFVFRRDAILDLLADLGVHVGVSIDSADPAVLSVLRRGANFGLMQANLERLPASYAALSIADRLNLYVTCQRPVLAALEDIVDFPSRADVHNVRLAPVGTRLAFLEVTFHPARTAARD